MVLEFALDGREPRVYEGGVGVADLWLKEPDGTQWSATCGFEYGASDTGEGFAPAEVFPQGDYLREELAQRGWTKKELAEMVRCPALVMGEIMDGMKRINPEIARSLGDALGASTELWLNLQANYNMAKRSW